MEASATAAAWIAAAVLLLAGGAKLVRPAGTVAALAATRLPSHPLAVRLLGVVELGIAAAVLGFAGPLPTALAALAYAGFVGFAAAHRRTPGASCGCFGEEEAPMRTRHVVVDAAVALTVAAAAVAGPAPLTVLGGSSPLAAVAALAAVALAAWLIRLHLTDAAALDEAVALHRGGSS